MRMIKTKYDDFNLDDSYDIFHYYWKILYIHQDKKNFDDF